MSGQVLYERGARVDSIYFMQRGVCSLISDPEGETLGVEVGMIGREGLVGASALLDRNPRALHYTIVQIPGSALRISEGEFRELCEELPELRAAGLRFVSATLAQASQSAACNARHSLPERCARWLLLSHDRVQGDELPLTQEFLAAMVGVRRAGVNIAAGALQKAGLIRYSRGQVTILDRAGLEQASCRCYGMIRQEFERLIGKEATGFK